MRLLQRRFREIEPIDRGFALGSRLFVAILPLALVAQRMTGGGTSFGQLLTATFDLEGAGRAAAEEVFAPADNVGAGLGLFAVIVLLYAVRGFARGSQRVYTDLWRVDLSGVAAVGWQMVWGTLLVVYVVFDIALAGLGLTAGSAMAMLVATARVVLFGIVWSITPGLLLGRRVPTRTLLPTIATTMLAVITFDAVSRLYFPAMVTENAYRYGLIGLAMSLFSWFFVNQTVVVLAALVGAVVHEWRHPARVEATADGR